MSANTSMKIKDFATGKLLSPSEEENVRQEYERILIEDYGYKKSEMDIEVPIPRGRGFFPIVRILSYFKIHREGIRQLIYWE